MPAEKYPSVTHVIFDMDGLLFDSEYWYTVGIQNIADRYGKLYTWDMKCQVMGSVAMDSARTLVKLLELPMTPEEFAVEVKEEYLKVMSNVKLLPGIEKLVNHLEKNNIPIAIATSSAKETYDKKVTNHKEFVQKFHHVVLGSADPEIKHGKPAPDIFLACASRFDDKPHPANVLVFEDAINGVKAAMAAGMPVVMIPDQRMDKSIIPDANQILKSAEDFKPELFNLPAYS